MAVRDVLAVGASAGGVEALRRLVAGLPADLPAAVLIVLHVPARSGTALPAILRRAGDIAVTQAEDGEPVRPGHVYVASPDFHLQVRGDRLVLARGPRENGHRPAVDVLFRSVTDAYGPRAMAMVLSGTLDDGAAGLHAVKAGGGLALVQDPLDAAYTGMPLAALAAVRPDLTGTVDQLAAYVVDQAGRPIPTRAGADGTPVDGPPGGPDRAARPGDPSGLSCPDCHGVLVELGDEALVHYRCHRGHAWNTVSLIAQQDSTLEHALWMALRSLEEKVALCRRMATAAARRGSPTTAERYGDAAAEASVATTTLRTLLHVHPGDPDRPGEPDPAPAESVPDRP